jgi:hypothetical protein
LFYEPRVRVFLNIYFDATHTVEIKQTNKV